MFEESRGGHYVWVRAAAVAIVETNGLYYRIERGDDDRGIQTSQIKTPGGSVDVCGEPPAVVAVLAATIKEEEDSYRD